MKTEIKKKEELNEQLLADLAKEKETQKQQSEKQKKELSQVSNEMQKHIGTLSEQVESSEKENARLNRELETTLKDIAEMKIVVEEKAVDEPADTAEPNCSAIVIEKGTILYCYFLFGITH